MDKDKKNHTLAVRVDDETYENITRKSFLLETTPSRYIRKLIRDDFLRDEEREIRVE